MSVVLSVVTLLNVKPSAFGAVVTSINLALSNGSMRGVETQWGKHDLCHA